MSIPGNRERETADRADRPLSTADLAAAARRHEDEDDTISNEHALNERDLSVAAPDADLAKRDLGVAERDERDADLRDADLTDRDATASARGAPRASKARPSEALEPLFTPDLTETYRQRWTAIQTGFVDDPRQAVRNGDELVAQIMTNLANTFADERQRVEAQLDQTGEGTTENLRVALRRYRSFFERLLAL